MFHLFKRIPLYLQLYFNEIVVTNLASGETIRRVALQPFSTKRFVIADFIVAEKTAREALRELSSYRRVFMPAYKAVVQQMEELEGGLSQIEIRAMRDLAEQCGAAWVKIVTHTRQLLQEEALNELRSEK